MTSGGRYCGNGAAVAADESCPTVRVVVVAAVRLYRDGLADALDRVEGIDVVGVAGDRAEAAALVRETRPDVTVVDASIASVPDALRGLAAHGAQIVAFGVPETESTMVELAEAGVVGYVSADGSVAEVVEIVRAAREGVVSCAPSLAAMLVRGVRAAGIAAERASRDAARATQAVLTAREWEIATLIADEGLSNKQIAQRLVIELPTVKNHVHSILGKLGVDGRAEAAALLRARELVS